MSVADSKHFDLHSFKSLYGLLQFPSLCFMSLPVIEIVTIPLQPDVTIEDQASQAGKEWKAAIEQLSCVAGCQRIYVSRYVEDKNKLQMFVGSSPRKSSSVSSLD